MRAWQTAPVEKALDPDRRIIDPHHHFWGAGYAGAEIFGRFLPQDAQAEIGKSGHRITASVYLECGWSYRSGGPEALRCVGETEFVEAAAQHCTESDARLGAGIVGHAELLLGDDVVPVLEAHIAASPARFKGVRDVLAYDAAVHNALNIRPEKSRDPRFRAGFRHLTRHGLSFDAWAFHPQLGELAELAQAFPDTTIIVNHLGGPIGVGRFGGQHAEAFGQWRAGIDALARYPNVILKLGGLGMEFTGFGWAEAATPPDSTTLAGAFHPYVMQAIEAFSPARCMFESNFPVDGISYGYGTLWNAFKRLAASFSENEQDDLFYGTAARTYRLTL
jgi:L-fuconolactonase